MTPPFVITQVNTLEAENALDNFISGDIRDAQTHFRDLATSIYLFCRLDEAEYTGRRILVVSEVNEKELRICIEAAYNLFDGDTNYHVERIGTVEREMAWSELPQMLQKAYDKLIMWKPTHENIWDNVY